jgi:hypothetical protein
MLNPVETLHTVAVSTHNSKSEKSKEKPLL